MTNLLEVCNIELAYAGDVVVRGASLSVPPRTITALLGRNGSGKSTLLKAIAGLLIPNGGRILFEGLDVTGWSPRRLLELGLGYVAETRACFPDLTVAENVAVGLSALRLSQGQVRDRREEAFANFPALGRLNDHYVRNLSGGLRQLLVIAMAMAQRPRCLVLDEPTRGLSGDTMSALSEQLRSFTNAGAGVLLVEQKPRFAFDTCDYAYYLESGVIAFCGGVDELRQNAAFNDQYLGGQALEGVSGGRKNSDPGRLGF